MSWLDALKGTIGMFPDSVKNETVSSSDIVRGTKMGDAFGLHGPANLPAVTERSAMQISAVWACTNLIAGAISTLPLNTYAKAKNGEKQLLLDHPYDLMFNQEFCPRWSASAGWSYSGQSRLLHGDVFIEIRRKSGFNTDEIDCLVPMHPNRVEVAVWNDGSRLVYIISPEANLPNGKVRYLDQDDVLHVPGFGFDGCRSLSPLQHALRNTGAVTLAAQNYSAQFFANQARPDYALVAPHEAKFDQGQIDDLREQVNERHAARYGQAGKPMLLTGGLKVESITLTNDDAELLATREFQIEDIARVYGTPPFMIGHNKGTTDWGSGVAERGVGFVRYVLRPHLTAFQNEFNRKVTRGSELVLDFDTFELERADLKTLFETFRSAVGRAGEPGILSVEEVRHLLNYPAEPELGTLKKETENEPQSAA